MTLLTCLSLETCLRSSRAAWALSLLLTAGRAGMSPGADVRLPVAGPWGLPRCSSSCRSPRRPEAVLPLPLLTVPVPSQDSPPFLPPSSRMRWASPTWKRTARRRRGVRPSPGPPSTPPRPCGRLARHLETRVEERGRLSRFSDVLVDFPSALPAVSVPGRRALWGAWRHLGESPHHGAEQL